MSAITYSRNMAGCWSLLKTGINLHGYLKFSVFMINSCVRTLRNSIWQVLPPRDKPQVFAFFYFRLFVCFYFSVTFSLISYFQMPDNFVQKQWPVCKQIRQGKLPVQDCERFHCCLVHEQRRKMALHTLKSRLHTAICATYRAILRKWSKHLIVISPNYRSL